MHVIATAPRLCRERLHVAHVLVGLSTSPSAPASAATQSSSGKRPATPFPGRCTRTLCRVGDILEGEGARFTGDGVSTLSGDSPLRTVGSRTLHFSPSFLAPCYA